MRRIAHEMKQQMDREHGSHLRWDRMAREVYPSHWVRVHGLGFVPAIPGLTVKK